MSDGHSGASVVTVDAKAAAAERDRLAKLQLQDSIEGKGLFDLREIRFGIPFTLKIVLNAGSSAEEVKTKALAILEEEFALVDGTLNSFNPNSEVSVLNALPTHTPHKMSTALSTVMACAVEVSQSSGGSFDPACAPMIEYLAKKWSGVPVQESADDVMSYSTLLSNFVVDFGSGTITRKHPKAKLDLGGISKGFAVDRVVERLNSANIRDCFFEWGGDCRGSGVNPRGSPWTVGIIRPPNLADLASDRPQTPPLIRVCHLSDEAIATSGDYEHPIVKSPQFVSSIFDWKQRSMITPSMDGVAQVSVRCYSCMYADALATACLAKRSFGLIRFLLENWRYSKHAVNDYTAYVRSGERVARMHEIATESMEMREKRISTCIPARVLIIGGGLAGLSAAIEAVSCGAHVILVEKTNNLGGNSAKATSGINAWGTRPQAEAGVKDHGKFFERDTHKSGAGGTTDPGNVRILSAKSADAIRWLQKFGLPLTVLSQLGGHSRKRTHRAPDKPDGTPMPIGHTIMHALEEHIRNQLHKNVTIMLNCVAFDLISEKNKLPDRTEVTRVRGASVLTAQSRDRSSEGPQAN